MLLKDFDYYLPAELIAQVPAEKREASRLMTLERNSGIIGEAGFATVADCFRSGDLLVLNDTRVIPARLLGTKESGGRAEVFLVRKQQHPGELWQCLIKASKPPQPGGLILFPGGMTCRVVERHTGESWLVSFQADVDFLTWLERFGRLPLPPYIKREVAESDRERYQTVFARQSGAVAAPTAGLHFTDELLQAVKARGVEIVTLTLHVGLGTFMPVRVEDLREHRMHQEYYAIPEETARAVNTRKKGAGRVIALGTTATRALEHAARPNGTLAAGEGDADIFIYPGYRFQLVDALITNFHLPQSTLLMLVAAFAGKDLLLQAYAEAVRRQFRFFSYGDAMFVY